MMMMTTNIENQPFPAMPPTRGGSYVQEYLFK